MPWKPAFFHCSLEPAQHGHWETRAEDDRSRPRTEAYVRYSPCALTSKGRRTEHGAPDVFEVIERVSVLVGVKRGAPVLVQPPQSVGHLTGRRVGCAARARTRIAHFSATQRARSEMGSRLRHNRRVSPHEPRLATHETVSLSLSTLVLRERARHAHYSPLVLHQPTPSHLTGAEATCTDASISFAQPRTERQRARQRRARLRDDPKTKPFTPGNTPQRASAAQPLAQGMRRQACHTPHRWEQAASAAADAGTVAEVHTQQKVQRGASAHAREPGGPNKLHP